MVLAHAISEHRACRAPQQIIFDLYQPQSTAAS